VSYFAFWLEGGSANYESAGVFFGSQPSCVLVTRFLPADDGIAIQALIATLHDSEVLAQRKVLEFIISHFPLISDPPVFRTRDQVCAVV
jgi:hypothetical protein